LKAKVGKGIEQSTIQVEIGKTHEWNDFLCVKGRANEGVK
jgi:hypothetical protein